MVAEQPDLWREGQEADDDELHEEETHRSGTVCVCVHMFSHLPHIEHQIPTSRGHFDETHTLTALFKRSEMVLRSTLE